MSKQLSITLRLVQQHKPYSSMWKTLVKAHGGVSADFGKSFPLSTVLDSNSLEDTLWCFKCLPEYEAVFARFTLFLIRHAERYTNDKRVPYCKSIIKEYVKGEVSTDELGIAVTNAYKAFDIACDYAQDTAHDAQASYEAAEMSARAVYYAGTCIADSYNGIEYVARDIAHAAAHYTRAVNYAINKDTNNVGHVTTCTFGTPTEEDINSVTTYAEETQKQTERLRKILDGEG